MVDAEGACLFSDLGVECKAEELDYEFQIDLDFKGKCFNDEKDDEEDAGMFSEGMFIVKIIPSTRPSNLQLLRDGNVLEASLTCTVGEVLEGLTLGVVDESGNPVPMSAGAKTTLSKNWDDELVEPPGAEVGGEIMQLTLPPIEIPTSVGDQTYTATCKLPPANGDKGTNLVATVTVSVAPGSGARWAIKWRGEAGHVHPVRCGVKSELKQNLVMLLQDKHGNTCSECAHSELELFEKPQVRVRRRGGGGEGESADGDAAHGGDVQLLKSHLDRTKPGTGARGGRARKKQRTAAKDDEPAGWEWEFTAAALLLGREGEVEIELYSEGSEGSAASQDGLSASQRPASQYAKSETLTVNLIAGDARRLELTSNLLDLNPEVRRRGAGGHYSTSVTVRASPSPCYSYNTHSARTCSGLSLAGFSRAGTKARGRLR